MPKKAGRPPTGDATKEIQYRVRMSPGENEKLEYCCEVYGLTKAEVIRQGIDKMYDEAQQKKE